jgi:hypothetical protein
MPLTDLTLVWLGSAALLVSAVQLLRVDQGTRVLAGFLAVIVWGAFGLSAYSVHSEAYSGTQPMLILVFFGFLMAVLLSMMSLFAFGTYLGLIGGSSQTSGVMETGGERR